MSKRDDTPAFFEPVHCGQCGRYGTWYTGFCPDCSLSVTRPQFKPDAEPEPPKRSR